MAITCVALDLGGVIVRYHAQWSGAMEAAGFEPKELGTLADFDLTHELGRGAIEFAEYSQGLSDYLGVSSAAEAEKVHNSILIGEYEGATNLVNRLKAKGIKVGALTNNNPQHLADCVRQIPVCRALDKIIASCEVGFNKPEEGIYRAFEKAFDANPNQIVLFDDIQENVDGGKRCGWLGYRVDPKGDPVAEVESILTTLSVL